MGATNDSIVAFFHRHLVPLCVIFAKKNKASIYVATAFVLSAEEEWFLVTAGHVALEIKSYMQDPKYCLKKAVLYDYGGLEAVYREPIPFDLTPDNILVLGDDTSLDYAVLHLRPHYKRLLSANGVEPLNEEVWCCQPQEPEFFMMLGVPHQMVSVEWNNDTKSAINQVKIATTLLHVEHAPQRPNGLDEKNYARWYGYVSITPPIDDIGGMSGAPIFAFKHMENGELRYWLVGVQSSWNRGNKAIAACPAQNLGEYLASAVRKYQDWQANQRSAPTPQKGRGSS